MRTRSWKSGTLAMGTLLGLGAAGCGSAPEQTEGAEQQASYLIIDSAARAAGYHLADALPEDAILPMELDGTSDVELVGPGGANAVPVVPGDVLHVRGAEGRLDWGTLGVDVDRDRLVLVGDEAAARAVAERVNGSIEENQGERFSIVAPSAFALGARGVVPEGLLESMPVKAHGLAASRAPSKEARYLADPSGVAWSLPSGGASAKSAHSGTLGVVDVMLPPAVSCKDAVVGTWVSREHYVEYGDWYVFTLKVARDESDPSKLHGTILARSWTGEPDLEMPIACSSLPQGVFETSFDWTVRMQAEGEVFGDAFRFEGSSWRPDTTRCGRTPPRWGYRLDSFAGTLTPGGQLIDALNNDGGRSIDDPHSFRRVSCE